LLLRKLESPSSLLPSLNLHAPTRCVITPSLGPGAFFNPGISPENTQPPIENLNAP
jgi:hypothetical protein